MSRSLQKFNNSIWCLATSAYPVLYQLHKTLSGRFILSRHTISLGAVEIVCPVAFHLRNGHGSVLDKATATLVQVKFAEDGAFLDTASLTLPRGVDPTCLTEVGDLTYAIGCELNNRMFMCNLNTREHRELEPIPGAGTVVSDVCSTGDALVAVGEFTCEVWRLPSLLSEWVLEKRYDSVESLHGIARMNNETLLLGQRGRTLIVLVDGQEVLLEFDAQDILVHGFDITDDGYWIQYATGSNHELSLFSPLGELTHRFDIE